MVGDGVIRGIITIILIGGIIPIIIIMDQYGPVVEVI